MITTKTPKSFSWFSVYDISQKATRFDGSFDTTLLILASLLLELFENVSEVCTFCTHHVVRSACIMHEVCLEYFS